MDNPGAMQLTFEGTGAFSIGAPGAMFGDWVTDLEGMLSTSVQFQFQYGGAGMTAIAYLQTSLDQGNTPIDIAAVEFTTANGVQAFNLSALTPKTTPFTPQQQALTPGTCVDGVLGDRLRVVVVVTGTYTSNTLINATAVVR